MPTDINTIAAWASILASFSTIAALIIAVRALKVWKNQKIYELRMDALAKSRIAIDLISSLRFADNYRGKFESKEHETKADGIIQDFKYFNQILDSQNTAYEDILKIREMLLDEFGLENKCTIFYTEVRNVIERIKKSHLERIHIINNHLQMYDDGKHRINEIYKVIMQHKKNDQITETLEQLYSNMIKK